MKAQTGYAFFGEGEGDSASLGVSSVSNYKTNSFLIPYQQTRHSPS
jgi:hypothetical protein